MGSWLSQLDASSSNYDSSTSAVPREGPSVLESASDVHISGGSFNAVGRDKVEYHFHLNKNATYDDNLISKIQDWLAPHVNYRAIQLDTFSKRTRGTGSWLLESRQFKKWMLESTGGVIWGVGIPGAGKTIIASIVIDHLQGFAKDSGPGEIAVAFAYCRYTDPIPIKVILSALIKQLLEDHPALVQLIDTIYSKHQRYKTEPTQEELANLLIEMSKTFKTTFFVLDGLDEAPDVIQFDLIKILSSSKAHFIITSRPLERLRSVLPEVVFFSIVADRGDIHVHVVENIERRPELERLLNQNNLKEEVISAICEKAQGMFLHATLQVEMLRDCLTGRDVQETLATLPEGIQAIYAAAVTRIKKQLPKHVSFAMRTLEWLVFAHGSLTVRDLQYALSVCLETDTFDPRDIVDEERLVSVCCGLVTIDASSQLVRLVHFTAQDALQPILLLDFPDPHGLLASTCVSRLISCQFHTWQRHDLSQTWSDSPFLRYAYEAWYIHARKCDRQLSAFEKVSAFVQRCQVFPVAITDRKAIDYANGLQVAAYYDLPELIDLGVYSDMRTPVWQRTPLMLALESPRTDVALQSHRLGKSAMFLLELPGIEVNATAPDGSTALILAARAGLEHVVNRLLQFSEIGINERTARGSTALWYASRFGHEGVVKLLLGRREIGVNANSPLGIASAHGHDRVVKLLLEHPELDISVQGMSALMVASCGGYDTVVKLLLGHAKLEVNRIDNYQWTALMYASHLGHVGVVKHLLGYQALEINAGESIGWTALMAASRSGNDSVVKLLLGHQGINVNAADKERRTALMWASVRGHSAVVELLLEHPGVEVNAVNRLSGRTALVDASSFGYNTVVELFLRHEAIEVNRTDYYGRTALINACKCCHDSIVKLFLARAEIDVNAADSKGWTALMMASRAGRKRIIQQLVEFPGIQLDARNNMGQTALDIGLANGLSADDFRPKSGAKASAKGDMGSLPLDA